MKIREIIKSNFSVTMFASIFHAGIVFIYGIFCRSQIPPILYGLFSTAKIIFNYLNYAQLGVLNSFCRDYPQAIGAGDKTKAAALRNTTFWFLAILYAVLAILISVVVVFIIPDNSIETGLRWGIVFVCAASLLSALNQFTSNILKSESNFRYASLTVIVTTITQAVVGCLLIMQFGYYGIYIALIAQYASGLIMNSKILKGIRFQFDKSLLKALIVTGLPLLINSFVWTVTMSTDQFVVLTFSDSSALGIYSVAQLAFSVMLLIPQSISQVLYVKLSNNYGKTKSIPQLLESTLKYTRLVAMFSSLLVVEVVFILPFFVKTFIPEYINGIEPAQIICLGVVFYATTMLYGHVFSVLQENKRLLLSTIALCISNIVLSVGIVVVLGFELRYVAIGTALSYVVYSLILILVLSRRHGVAFFDILKMTWGPVFLTLAPNVVAFFLIPTPMLKMLWAIVFAVIVLIVFILFRRKRHA